MNFRQIKLELDDLYAGVTHDGKGDVEEFDPQPGDEWVIQRNHIDADDPYVEEPPWANGEPEDLEYIEVLALAVVQ